MTGSTTHYIAVTISITIALSSLLPGAARAQTLPAEQHPSLLFTADDIPELKERIQREPYATWWQTVLSRAESTPDSFSDERSKARFAKSLAFAYLMTDDVAHAERAVELLEEMQFPPRAGDLGEPHNEGEVVAIYAVAYDMIHDFVAADAQSLEEIRTILAEEAQRLYDGIVILVIPIPFLADIVIRLHETPDPRDLGVLHLDNWHIRAYGGLGLAALALSDHAGLGNTPQEWSDRAFDLVTRSLWHQIDETDGGYAEGPFYSRYAADVYLPYMFALKDLTGTDLLTDARVRKMHDWSLNLRLPNGRRPNIEDGHVDDFYGHYLSAVYEDGGVNRWDWENNGRGLYVREFSEADAIAIYDDSIVAREPDRGPTIFMPEAGDAVFRSDWSADATYMLLRGEHGRARAQGLGHEHADETSFIIYAGGEMLALDSGYINFANHNRVNRGENHNVILVDGEGPPNTIIDGESIDGGNDAFIEQFFTSTFSDYAEVSASYAGVDVRRRVLFADGSYFVLADELRDDQAHIYKFLLHGHGGGNSGGTYARVGSLARWTQTDAELLAYMPTEAALTFSEEEAVHSFDFLEEPTHTVLQAEQSGDNAEFLTVLYPRSLDGVEPSFADVTTEGGQAVRVTIDAGQDVAWVRNAAAAEVGFDSPAGDTRSDGVFGLARFDGQDVSAFSVQDGTFLRAGGSTPFLATEAVDISIEAAQNSLAGFVRGPESGYELSVPLVGSVESADFTGTLEGTSVSDGILTLQLAGEGKLTLSIATGVKEQLEGLPADYQLLQNYPNPFNAGTTIVYQVPEETRVDLAVFNLTGQRVKTLVDDVKAASIHQVHWDGTDATGAPVGSGAYLYRMRAGDHLQTRSLLLLK